MKFGVNTFIWTAAFDSSHFPLLPGIKKAGFDGVEIAAHQPGSSERRRKSGRALAENQLECTFCSVIPGGMSVISDDAEVCRKTRRRILRNLHPGSRGGRGKADRWSDLFASGIFAGPQTKSRTNGDGRSSAISLWVTCCERNDITLAIEPLNRFETYFLNTAEDAAALCEAVGHPQGRNSFRYVPRQYRREKYRSRVPQPGPALEARAYLRKRSRNAGHRPCGLERRVRGAPRSASTTAGSPSKASASLSANFRPRPPSGATWRRPRTRSPSKA